MTYRYSNNKNAPVDIHRVDGEGASGDPSYRALFVAVILQACKDTTISSSLRKGHAPVHRDEARKWFADGGEDFRETCHAAGVDPDALRSAYLRGDIAKAFGAGCRDQSPRFHLKAR